MLRENETLETEIMKKILFILIALPTFALADTFKLVWDAPTQNTDGTPVSLKGYKLYKGTKPGVYTHTSIPNVPAYTLTLTTPATYYLAVTAVSTRGIQSLKSNVLKVVVVPKPTAPANLR